MTMKTRRVGTLTLGATLVTFGILFLLRIFNIAVDYMLIAKLWPVIFIFLGIEIIVSYFMKKEEHFSYDFAAIVIIIVLSLFAMCMGAAELWAEHAVIYY